MTIPVIIILGCLWAAVLVPPLLRSRSDRHGGGIGEYAHTLGVLKSSTKRLNTMTRPAAGLVDGAMHGQQVSRSNEIKKRRRDILTGLLVACGITFLLALFMGNTTLWFLHIMCDLILAAYVYMLIQIKEQQRLKRMGGTPQRRA